MDCARALLYLTVCLSLVTAVTTSNLEGPPDLRGSRDPPDLRDFRDLFYRLVTNDLSEMLHEDEQSVEKKNSIIPRCDVGERCAMKHGPRIGRLCDCLRGAACNTFFLRCY